MDRDLCLHYPERCAAVKAKVIFEGMPVSLRSLTQVDDYDDGRDGQYVRGAFDALSRPVYKMARSNDRLCFRAGHLWSTHRHALAV